MIINALSIAGALVLGMLIGARWGIGRFPRLRKNMAGGGYHSLGSIMLPKRPGWKFGRSADTGDTWLSVTVNKAGRPRIHHLPVELPSGPVLVTNK